MTLGPTYPQPHEDADGTLVPQILEHGPTLPVIPSMYAPKGKGKENPIFAAIAQELTTAKFVIAVQARRAARREGLLAPQDTVCSPDEIYAELGTSVVLTEDDGAALVTFTTGGGS